MEPCLLPLRQFLDPLVLSQLIRICILFPQWVLFLLLSGHGLELFHVNVHPPHDVGDSLHADRNAYVRQAVARRFILDREQHAEILPSRYLTESRHIIHCAVRGHPIVSDVVSVRSKLSPLLVTESPWLLHARVVVFFNVELLGILLRSVGVFEGQVIVELGELVIEFRPGQALDRADYQFIEA